MSQNTTKNYESEYHKNYESEYHKNYESEYHKKLWVRIPQKLWVRIPQKNELANELVANMIQPEFMFSVQNMDVYDREKKFDLYIKVLIIISVV